ncbi:MAG: hypothetical protein LAC70_06120 [Methylovulum sp.]|nr:hypothetical protein [Methylovulum sp.]
MPKINFNLFLYQFKTILHWIYSFSLAPSLQKLATNLTRDTQQGLTVRPELVEGGTVG